MDRLPATYSEALDRIRSLEEHLSDARQNEEANLRHMERLASLLQSRTMQLQTASGETLTLAQSLVPKSGEEMVTMSKAQFEAATTAFAKSQDRFLAANLATQELALKMLEEAKQQFAATYRSLSRDMEAACSRTSSLIANVHTISDVLIPLVRLPNFRHLKFSCNGSQVYIDLTRPEDPETNENDKFDVGNYEYGLIIEAESTDLGILRQPAKFTLRPEFQKGFCPPELTFSVGSIAELIDPINFCIANIEPAIVQYLRKKEQTVCDCRDPCDAEDDDD